MPASRLNCKSARRCTPQTDLTGHAPSQPRSVASATARLWRGVRRAARKAAVPVAAAALVFPNLMSPKPAAADGIETVEQDGVVSLGEFGGTAALSGDSRHYLFFNKWVNEGVGFQDSFQSVGIHGTLKDWGTTSLWADGRVLITDHSRIGYNTMLGMRRLVGDGVVGGWLGYDNWESNNGYRYDQISFGGEALFQAFDVRGNAYVALDDDPNLVRFLGQSTAAPRFGGNSLLFNDPALFEESFGGWDLEVGTQLLPAMRGYVGMYGLYPDLQDSAIGVSGRAEVRVSEEVNVQFIGSNDDIYGGSFNVVAEVLFSGRPNAVDILPCWDCDYRKYGQVRRRWPVATLASRGFAERAAQKNGRDLSFAFVDNTAAAGGDGSAESPFSSLPDSVDADFVLVDRGAGATLGNITLQRGQQLLGEGKPIVLMADRGMFVAPGFDTDGGRPLLRPDAADQPVVTLAGNTTVSNFQIVGNDMIAAIAGGRVDNFLIDCVDANSAHGVRVTNATGLGVIRDSNFLTTGTDGVFVGNNGGMLDLRLDDVSVAGRAGGGQFGVRVATSGGDVSVRADDLDISNVRNTGILGTATDGSLTFVGDGVDVTGGMATNAFRFEGTNSDVAAVLSDVTGEATGDVATLDVTGGRGVLDVTGGVLSGSDTGSGVVANFDNATGRVALSGVRASDNALDGLNVDAVNGSSVAVVTDGLNVNRSGRDGAKLRADGSAAINADLDGLAANQVGRDGLMLMAMDGGRVSASGTGVGVNAAGRDGLVAVTDGGMIDLDLADVSANAATFDAVEVAAVGGGSVTGEIDGLTANNAGDDAVFLGAISDGNVSLALSDVVAIGVNGNGLDIIGGRTGSNGSVAVDLTDADFSGAFQDNIAATSQGTDSVARINANGVTASNSRSGDGISLLADNGAMARLIGTDVTADNNARNNLDLTASGADSDAIALITGGSLDNAGMDGVSVTGTDGGRTRLDLSGVSIEDSDSNGIDINLDGADTSSLVTLSGPGPITGSVMDAIDYDVTGGADLTLRASNIDASGSGQFGIDGNVQGDSVVSVELSEVLLGDGGAGGVDLDVGTMMPGATQTFILQNGDLSDTDGSGLAADTGPNSRTDIVLRNVDASGNEVDNVRATYVTADGMVTLDGVNADGAGESGVMLVADGGSDLDVDIDNLTASGNGDDGLSIASRVGSIVRGDVDTVTATGNGRDGVRLLSRGGSILDLDLEDVVGDGNMRGGFMLDATDGGEATVNVVSGSFSGNEQDGVNVFTSGVGSLADVCFHGTDADDNGDIGYQLAARDGATLVAELRSIDGDILSASNNVNEGLRLDSSDAEGVYLLMSGANVFDGNSTAAGNGVTLNVVGADTAALQFAGSVSGAAEDGVNIRVIDAMLAAIEIGDPALGLVDDGMGGMNDTRNTLTGNGDDGLDLLVRSNDADQTRIDTLQVPVGKNAGRAFSSFRVVNLNTSENGDEGTVIELDNVEIAAGTLPSIDGNISSDNPGGDGISVTVRDSNLPGTFSVSDNVANSNDEFGIDIAILDSTVGALDVDDNTTVGNGSGGVRIFIDPSIVSSGSMSGNVSTDNEGNGLSLIVEDSDLSNFVVTGNLSALNTGLGIDVVSDNSFLENLRIVDNFGGDIGETAVLFNVFNQAFFGLANTSVLDADLTSFRIDLSGTMPNPIIFDTIEPGVSTPFTPFGVTDVTTGLETVNGQDVVAGTRPLEDPNGNALPGGGLPDAQSILDLGFGDFNPNEAFLFFADTDFMLPGNAQMASVPTQEDFLGAPATATFSNGSVLDGVLVQTVGGVGIALTSAVDDDRGFIRNEMGGARVTATDSQLIGFEFSGNRVQDNEGDGLELILDNTDLTGSTIAGNSILSNDGDGIRLVNPDAAGQPITLDLVDNRVDANVGAGLNISLDDDNSLVSRMAGNSASNNGEDGMRFDLSDSATGDVILGDSGGDRSFFSGNDESGLQVTLSDAASAVLNVENIEFSDSGADGVLIVAEDNAEFRSLRFGDAGTAESVEISSNLGSGLSLTLRDNAVVDDGSADDSGLQIRNASITENTLDGVRVARSGNAYLDSISVVGSDLSRNVDTGLDVTLSGGSADIVNGGVLQTSVVVRESTIADNGNIISAANPMPQGEDLGGSGVRVTASADARFALGVVDSSVTGNEGDGVDVNLSANAEGVVAVDDSTFNGVEAGGDLAFFRGTGLSILAEDTTQVDVSVANTTFADFGGTGTIFNDNGFDSGIELNANDESVVTGSLLNVDITRVGGDGIRLRAAGDADLTLLADTITSTDNAGNGLDLRTIGDSEARLELFRAVLSDNGVNSGVADGAAAGINLDADFSSELSAFLTDVRSVRNAGEGARLNTFFDATLRTIIDGTNDPVPSSGADARSSFSSNGLTGIYANNGVSGAEGDMNSSDADLILRVFDSAVIGNGGDGMTAAEMAGIYFDGAEAGTGINFLELMGNEISGNAGAEVLVE